MNDERESSNNNGSGGEAPRKRPAVGDLESQSKKPKEDQGTIPKEDQGTIIPKDQRIILPPSAAMAVPQWKRDMDKERAELDKKKQLYEQAASQLVHDRAVFETEKKHFEEGKESQEKKDAKYNADFDQGLNERMDLLAMQQDAVEKEQRAVQKQERAVEMQKRAVEIEKRAVETEQRAVDTLHAAVNVRMKTVKEGQHQLNRQRKEVDAREKEAQQKAASDAKRQLQRKEKEVADREKEVKDRQTSLQQGENEVAAQRKEINEAQLQLQRNEKEVADRQACREKAIEAREKEVAAREKNAKTQETEAKEAHQQLRQEQEEVDAREKDVAAREKAIQDGQAHHVGGTSMERGETSDDEEIKDVETGSCVLVDIPVVDDPSSVDDYEAFEGVIMKRKWEVCFEDGERRDFDDEDMKDCVHDFKEHCLKGRTKRSQQEYVRKLKATVQEKYDQGQDGGGATGMEFAEEGPRVEETDGNAIPALNQEDLVLTETGNGENEDSNRGSDISSDEEQDEENIPAYELWQGKKYFTCPPNFREGDIVQANNKDSRLRYKLPGDNDWSRTT
ncbi:MAG: hypothetical protein SGARI_001478, partial [Bacillariaceae sp.]